MRCFLKVFRDKLFFIFVFLHFLVIFSLAQGLAVSASIGEYEVKALFIYNFARFVQWPAGTFEAPDDPINLYVIGKDPFGKGIDLLRDKVVRDRAIHVHYLKEWEDIEPDCHILFVGVITKGHINRILEQAEEHHILTVSDMEDFARMGGVIKLFTRDKKVKFRINLSAAERANLVVSSNLLKLAEVLKE